MKKYFNKILSVILSLSLIYQPCTATGNNYSKIKNNTSSLSNKKMSTKDKIAYYGLAVGALAISAGVILSYLDPKSSDSNTSNQQPKPNKQSVKNKYSCSKYKTKKELDELGINNGLYNVGNSCYMNAMLQQLYSIDAFREWIIHFRDNQHVSDIPKQTLNKIKAMKSVFKYMSGEEKTDLESLMSALGHRGRQEDSVYSTQSKWEDVFELFIKEKIANSNNSSYDKGKNYLFRGLVLNSETQNLNFDELLKVLNQKEYFKPPFTTFDGQFMLSKFLCCGSKVELTPNETLTSENIDAEEKDKNYKLTGVIIHEGTLYYGHYYSYKFNAKDKEWYEYNDSRVTQVNYDDIRDNIYTNAVAFTYTDVDKLK